MNIPVVKKKKKKTIQTKKKKDTLVIQQTVVPVLESPLEIWGDFNRMYLEEPGMKPWWTIQMLNQPANLLSEKRMKLIPINP